MKSALLWIVGGAAAASGALVAYGCVVADSCAADGTCPPENADAHEGGGGACGDGTTCSPPADASGGEDVFTCDPSQDPKDEPCVLADAYGVFVASVAAEGGTDAGDGGALDEAADGSMAHPFPAIGEALAHLGGKGRIFVCDGVYAEQVLITAPVSLYGGLSCEPAGANRLWRYVGGTAQVSSPSPAYALSVAIPPSTAGVDANANPGVDSGEGDIPSGAVVIEDMTFASPAAIAPGESSIAAFIASSSLTLARVTLHAGDGANGAAGGDGASVPNSNYTGSAPVGGGQVLSDQGLASSPGAGGSNVCLHFGASAGGDGGIGCALDAGFGTVGTATPAAPVVLAGQDGLPRLAALTDGGMAILNDPGADGIAGDGGVALPAYGTLSPSGWAPSTGGDGAPGSPGQGGAGASDPLANSNCNAPLATIGGGGGGSGGCGGAGGHGGSGGGGSIALASFESTVILQSCVLSAQAGGAGGAGGAGQDGQAGAAGGDDTASSFAHAAGASGGNGAAGSGGAGGSGGISVAVLYTGARITYDPPTLQSITLGPPGSGGPSGLAGKHAVGGALPTGADGNSGGPGTAGTSAAFLEAM